MRLDRLAVSDGIQSLGGFRLDGDMVGTDAEDYGQSLAHLRDIRGELRFLRDDRDVGVADPPTLEFRQGERLSEQGFAGCARYCGSSSG